MNDISCNYWKGKLQRDGDLEDVFSDLPEIVQHEIMLSVFIHWFFHLYLEKDIAFHRKAYNAVIAATAYKIRTLVIPEVRDKYEEVNLRAARKRLNDNDVSSRLYEVFIFTFLRSLLEPVKKGLSEVFENLTDLVTDHVHVMGVAIDVLSAREQGRNYLVDFLELPQDVLVDY